ncbi:Ribonucleases P MRP subunit pop1 [Hyphodiscus hymeniophilus]|uniref:Ribonucleases P MRP subunit pop1 n=1 Tax=Hyphodiscus hymeniophilus TaxID=353542 RepID=A0A9P6VP68_9HELO|nr:Ribonucleases P MRP subunit pop1 [Hyphodiscus hymeniophilus]
MPPKRATELSAGIARPTKRKEPPQSSANNQKSGPNGRDKRVKLNFQDARSILTQSADTALSNGELDLQSFLKSREFEIKALENGMQKAKKSLTTRAFQEVPRDLRRRTASHNVKRVPKRLENRAKREMREDNTPTVNPSKRKPGSSRGRLRAETAKRLGILAAKKRDIKGKEVDVTAISTREARPKLRRNLLNDPPKPKSKFRKRQIHKTWLPTHMWHAKRAKMTEPKNPLWRFSIPITCTEKSYRPTHRATGARGAVAWDMSYMSTISLEGTFESLEKVLKAVGVTDQGIWEKKGDKWRSGSRSWCGWLSREVKDQRLQIAPATIIWRAQSCEETNDPPKRKPIRHLFIRSHPSAFLETWNELLRLSKLQRPSVHVQDLRFEIGSIEITGPGSTEALLGILHPYQLPQRGIEPHGEVFKSLAGITNAASLPPNSLLGFSIADPRLRYPPRTVVVPKPTDEEANFALLQTLSAWPADASTTPSALFDRDLRFKATRFPSQKSINRRKAQADPGCYPQILPTDQPIPIMLLTSRMTPTASAQGTWTVLAPWKCILPVWYGLVHYPLSSGGNPRFGGLDEMRQIHFEHSVPWFPRDFPGTSAGFAWETDGRLRRKADWDRRPKGKRTAWDSLDLGGGRKGEIGYGWACDFERLLLPSPSADVEQSAADITQTTQKSSNEQAPSQQVPIQHFTAKAFTSLLSSTTAELPRPSTVATVCITLTSRGVAEPCARIYHIPGLQPTTQCSDNKKISSKSIREQWLPLIPSATKSKPPPNSKSKTAKEFKSKRTPLNTPMPQRIRLLAQSLLQNPPLPYPANKDDGHPLVPDEEDLIGFVTTGEFNLAEGKGVAIGTVLVAKAVEGLRRENKAEIRGGRWCVVRNAGEKVGRLGRWDPV